MAGRNNGDLCMFLNGNAINTQGQGFFKMLKKIMSGNSVTHSYFQRRMEFHFVALIWKRKALQ